MKVLTLKQRESVSIYQLEHQHHDIEIRFAQGKEYAVVMPSYYNATPTTHSTLELAAKAAKKLIKQNYLGVTIIDSDGKTVDCD